MQPLFDNLSVIRPQFSEKSDMFQLLQLMLEEEKLTIEPLAYIRGRSLVKMFMIVDEAQKRRKPDRSYFNRWRKPKIWGSTNRQILIAGVYGGRNFMAFSRVKKSAETFLGSLSQNGTVCQFSGV